MIICLLQGLEYLITSDVGEIEDEDFSVYLESYSKKEIIQVLTKVVFNTLKASQSIPLQMSSADASQS